MDLIAFLNRLEAQKIFYPLEKQRYDSVMVIFTTVGKRIELDFFEDHIEYSIFSGDEGVLDDEKTLFDIIASHV